MRFIRNKLTDVADAACMKSGRFVLGIVTKNVGVESRLDFTKLYVMFVLGGFT